MNFRAQGSIEYLLILAGVIAIAAIVIVFLATNANILKPNITCFDGIDNDGDSYIDMLDPDCIAGASLGENTPQTGPGTTCQTDGCNGVCQPNCSGLQDPDCEQICRDGCIIGTETCDLSSLAGQTCLTQGFTDGTLGCYLDCTAFDTSLCTNCGNGIREGTEQCDGLDFASQTCETQGFSVTPGFPNGGELQCNNLCLFDYSKCNLEGTINTECGNSTCEYGETPLSCPSDCSGGGGGGGGGGSTGDIVLFCGDGSCSNNETCSSCPSDCGTCPVSTVCGNNIIQALEACDGTALNNQTCITKGFESGTLACLSDCTDFDTSNCVSSGTVARSLSSDSILRGTDVSVSLNVTVGSQTYYAIDEAIPNGWTIKSNGGGDTSQPGHLKWVVYTGAATTTYTYVLTAPDTAGTGIFAGQYMFENDADGQPNTITGPASITVS